MSAPHGSNGWLFVLGATLIVLAGVIGWWVRTERARTGSMLPWMLLGGALSTVFAATTSAALGIQYGSAVRGGVVVLGTDLPLALVSVNALVMGGQAVAGIAIQVVCVIGCATVVFLIKPVIRAARVALVTIPVVVTAAMTGLLCPLVTVAVHDQWSPTALGAVGLATGVLAVVLSAAMGRVVAAAPRLLPAITYWGPTSTEYHSRRAAPVRAERTAI